MYARSWGNVFHRMIMIFPKKTVSVVSIKKTGSFNYFEVFASPDCTKFTLIV